MYCKFMLKRGANRLVLKEFIASALDGSFKVERFNTDKSCHLKYFKQVEPAMFGRWKGLCGTRYEIDGKVVTLSDDPEDFFMMACPPEIYGSCKDPSGEGDQKIALMDTVMDGRNQLLVVHDSRGKLLSRAVLQQGFIGKSPVLMLFSTLGHSQHNKEEFMQYRSCSSKSC